MRHTFNVLLAAAVMTTAVGCGSSSDVEFADPSNETTSTTQDESTSTSTSTTRATTTTTLGPGPELYEQRAGELFSDAGANFGGDAARVAGLACDAVEIASDFEGPELRVVLVTTVLGMLVDAYGPLEAAVPGSTPTLLDLTSDAYCPEFASTGEVVTDLYAANLAGTAPKMFTDHQPIVLSGSGDSVVPVDGLPPGRFLRASTSAGSNFIVAGLDAGGQRISGYVNEIGPWSGEVIADADAFGSVAFFEVKASGAWELVFVDIAQAQRVDREAGFSGDGSAVRLVENLAGPTTFSTTGGSNFIVAAYDVFGRRVEGLVNEIGPYTGTTFTPSAQVLGINAEGSWTVAPA